MEAVCPSETLVPSYHTAHSVIVAVSTVPVISCREWRDGVSQVPHTAFRGHGFPFELDGAPSDLGLSSDHQPAHKHQTGQTARQRTLQHKYHLT
jgi:hypothetical protein